MIIKAIRWIVGKIILFLDAVFQPASLKRSSVDQAKVDAETEKLKLYQFKACPFCVKVRREMKRLGLKIETRDTKIEGPYRDELMAATGKVKAPCLKIEKENAVEWMYESNDIIAYLQNRFGQAA